MKLTFEHLMSLFFGMLMALLATIIMTSTAHASSGACIAAIEAAGDDGNDSGGDDGNGGEGGEGGEGGGDPV